MFRMACIIVAVALAACGGEEDAGDEGRYVLEGDALNTQGLVLASGEVIDLQNTNELDEAALGASDIYLHVGNTRLLVGSAPPGDNQQLAFCFQGEGHDAIEDIDTETMYCKWQAANLGEAGEAGEAFSGHGYLLRPPAGGFYRLLIRGVAGGNGAQTTVTFEVAAAEET